MTYDTEPKAPSSVSSKDGCPGAAVKLGEAAWPISLQQKNRSLG